MAEKSSSDVLFTVNGVQLAVSQEMAERARAGDQEVLKQLVMVASALQSQSRHEETEQQPLGNTVPVSTCATEEVEVSPAWTKAVEKLLLETFKEVESSKTLIRNKWIKIASVVNTKGSVSFTAEQCRLKIKALKEKFERAKKKNDKSGSEAVYIDKQLEEAFEKCPDVQPSYVIGGQKRKDGEDSEEEDENANVPLQCKKPAKRRTSSEDVKDCLLEQLKQMEESNERRHKEKVEVVNKLTDVIKDYMKH